MTERAVLTPRQFDYKLRAVLVHWKCFSEQQGAGGNPGLSRSGKQERLHNVHWPFRPESSERGSPREPKRSQARRPVSISDGETTEAGSA